MKTFEKIRRTRNHFTFVWALTNLFDIGIIEAKEITDAFIEEQYQKEIERQKEIICWYTPEVVRDMWITTKELTFLKTEDLINGIVKADLWKANKISWDRMCEVAGAAIQNLDEFEKECFISDCDLNEEEAEWFGIEMGDEE